MFINLSSCLLTYVLVLIDLNIYSYFYSNVGLFYLPKKGLALHMMNTPLIPCQHSTFKDEQLAWHYL